MSAEILFRLETSLHDMPAEPPHEQLAGIFQKIGELDAVLKEHEKRFETASEYINALEFFLKDRGLQGVPDRPKEGLDWVEAHSFIISNIALLRAGADVSIAGELPNGSTIWAVSWMLPEDWPQWQAIDDQLPEYEQWLNKIEAAKKEMKKQKMAFEMVTIEPEHFSKWCRLKKRAVNRQSRSQYAVELLTRQLLNKS